MKTALDGGKKVKNSAIQKKGAQTNSKRKLFDFETIVVLAQFMPLEI